MVLKASAAVKIPFHDVDILNVVWHGHYIKYFEVARTALMQSLALDWPELKKAGVAMPVVEVHVKYRRPLLYDAQVWVEASIDEYAYPELKVQYAIRESAEGDVLATGWTRQIYFCLKRGESLFDVPPLIRERLAGAQ